MGGNCRKRALNLLSELSSLYDNSDPEKKKKQLKKAASLSRGSPVAMPPTLLSTPSSESMVGMQDEDIGEMIVSQSSSDLGKSTVNNQNIPASERTDILCKSALLRNMFGDTPDDVVAGRVCRPLYLEYITNTTSTNSILSARDSALRERKEAVEKKRREQEKMAKREEHRARQKVAQLKKDILSSAQAAKTLSTNPLSFFSLTASGISTNLTPGQVIPSKSQSTQSAQPLFIACSHESTQPDSDEEHRAQMKVGAKNSKTQIRKEKRKELLPKYKNLSEVISLFRNWWTNCYQATATQFVEMGSTKKGGSKTYLQNASLAGDKTSISNIVRAKAEAKKISKGWALHLSNRTSKKLEQAAAMGVKVDLPPPPKPQDLPSSLAASDLGEILTRSFWEEHVPSVTKGWCGAWVTLLRHEDRATLAHTSGFIVGVTKQSLFIAIPHSLHKRDDDSNLSKLLDADGKQVNRNASQSKSLDKVPAVKLSDISVRIRRFAKSTTRLFIHWPTTPKPRGHYSTDVTKLPDMITGDSVLLELEANFLCSDEEATYLMGVV